LFSKKEEKKKKKEKLKIKKKKKIVNGSLHSATLSCWD
jgi:hypothetical protein